ncbi:helix-turn-helix transcriptional regulator [Roseovarius sp. A21]|uniref:Helix-turn-helix transcriptional regulator n=1 Tax=Roseovarius bejariae TaxID=2576383 RepID=A0A844CI89_9RHOB|nr:AraC family transcriptional regulator [Roseovarius bejariae]MRU14387.1 helix-turn-helix transcriptional regulator [Roseovarius bejariae]
MQQRVPDFLAQAPDAHAIAGLDLGRGFKVAIWENSSGHITYDGPRGHTFSLYLQGGSGTKRLDAGAVAGFPGAICVMPEGHRSEWQITAPFRFVHLYAPDDHLRAGFARMTEQDARRLSVQEATFVMSPRLAVPLMQMAQAATAGDILLADSALIEMLGQLPDDTRPLHGGLAPRTLRHIDDWIAAHLDQTIRLADLARVADLSEFHFHRMFRSTRGVSPHKWITARRVEFAKARLAGTDSLCQIAQDCGFSCQSHLSRVFRSETGLTPGAFRKLVRTHH